MRIYLVAYDLANERSKARDEELKGAIKVLTGAWWKQHEGFWLIATPDLSEREVFERLSALLPLAEGEIREDTFFVAELAGTWTGWQTKAAWKWLTEARDQWKLPLELDEDEEPSG